MPATDAVRSSIMEFETALPETWSDVRDGGPGKSGRSKALEVELVKELSVGHLLHGRALSVVAHSEANDDVLITLNDDGTWAVVHLTWRGTAERPPWPMTVTFPAMADAVAAIHR